MEVLKIFGNRREYSMADAAKQSMTVSELIDYLNNFDGDTKVVISNDGGYTYGYVNRHFIGDETESVCDI